MIDVVTGIRGNSINPGVVDVVTRIRGGGQAKNDVVTRIRGNSATTFTVRFAPPLRSTVNPFELIALTVAPSLPADTVTVTRVSGLTVAIAGTGLDRSAVAPGTITGGVIVFRATATKAGFATATVDYSVTVTPHGGLFRRDGSAVQIH